MHAWLCETLDGADALQWKELPTPGPKPGEVGGPADEGGIRRTKTGWRRILGRHDDDEREAGRGRR